MAVMERDRGSGLLLQSVMRSSFSALAAMSQLGDSEEERNGT